MEELQVTQSLQVFDVINFINRKKKLHQRLILNGIEEQLGKDSEEYAIIRKLVLDNTNEVAREIVKIIFGDAFEGIIK